MGQSLSKLCSDYEPDDNYDIYSNTVIPSAPSDVILTGISHSQEVERLRANDWVFVLTGTNNFTDTVSKWRLFKLTNK